MLAARAAEAIQTARMHDAARRAAQTRQMLLRELNHRVKNNLASIVALLSIDRPEMPEQATAWLNRASERIVNGLWRTGSPGANRTPYASTVS